MTLSKYFRWLLDRLKGRWMTLVTFLLVAELLSVFVLAPLSAGLLSLFLNRWGRCSVGNFELASFVLSPEGGLATLGVGTVATGTLYFELAGVMLLLNDRRRGVVRTIGELIEHARPIAWLAFRQLAVLLLLALPFLLASGLLLKSLWHDHDVNGLLVLKPAIFWVGVGGVTVLLAGYAVLAGRLLLRWFIALPLLLVDAHVRPQPALQASIAATEGQRAAILRSMAVWLIVQAALSVALTAPLHWTADFVLDRIGLSFAIVLPVTGMFALAHLLAVVVLSIWGATTLGGLLLAWHATCLGTALPESVVTTAEPDPPLNLSRVRVAAVILVAMLVSLIASAVLLNQTQLEDELEITAHRGGALDAPENTVAAIRGAIAARADWAEIDVQRSADGVVVVLHDADLRRVAGLARRVREMTLAELKELDVGTAFGAGFAGERIATLDEVIAAAGDSIRLNIEFKPDGPDDIAPLVESVINMARGAGILGRCRVCSQSFEAIQLARELAPEVEIGFIAGAAIGNLAALDVEFLMVNASMATRRLIDAARVRGIDVHAWTVNNPDELVPLLDRGVANLITDDPAAMRERLNEVRALHPTARLLLRTRGLLAD